MSRHAIFLLTLFLCYHILSVDVVTSTHSLYKGDDVDMGNDIQLMNTTSIKTMKVGTTPNQKMPKTDYSREIGFSKASIMGTNNRPNTYLAVARTKDGPQKYSGAESALKLENPKLFGKQYTATRLRLQSGTDSIEAGWRVDPSLYGDSRTRFFIRTDTGDTHCFNTRCPGFIQTFDGFNFDDPLENISVPGSKGLYVRRTYITKDVGSGNWNLLLWKNRQLIGYWPSHIFTKLAYLADRVEWGGVAYSPPGIPLPPMGSGNKPIGDMAWDGSICRMKVLNEKGETVDPTGIEIYTDDSNLYSVLQAKSWRPNYYTDERWGYVIFYGGSGH